MYKYFWNYYIFNVGISVIITTIVVVVVVDINFTDNFKSRFWVTYIVEAEVSFRIINIQDEQYKTHFSVSLVSLLTPTNFRQMSTNLEFYSRITKLLK